ncbi:SH3 domain-containing protein 21 [Heptranchias perlo]|uniref:SH3 domain-containing protein 21 n=1 Tax=Heptranchias perlo TaxID=212740 RepID=UPI003559CDED
MVEFVAVSCFETQVEDKLTLQVGDIIKNARCTGEKGWWEGEINGKRGYFPRTFVEEVPSHAVADGNRIQPRSIRRKHAVRKKKQRWCEVVISYSPVKPDKLDLNLGDIIEVLDEIEDGWWLGRKNGKIGGFPSNFVIEMDKTEGKVSGIDIDSSLGAMNEDGPSSVLQDPIFRSAHLKADIGNPGVGRQQMEYYKAVFDYVASTDDELSLLKGDVILVLDKETEDYGWWEGYVNGNQGLFPDNYVVPYLEATELRKELPPKVRTDVDISSKSDAMATAKAPELSLWKIDHRDEKKELRNEWLESAVKPNPMTLKKVPPPVKVKPMLVNLPNKVNGEDALPLRELNQSARDRTSDSDSVTFGMLAVSAEKLSHPTVDRPKPQGRRPPSQFAASPAQVAKRSTSPAAPAKVTAPTIQVTEPSPHQTHWSAAVKPSTVLCGSLNKPKREAESEDKDAAIAALRAEMRSLQLSLDLLKNQHLIDITDLKEEISEERTKRNILQVEVEKLRKFVTSL